MRRPAQHRTAPAAHSPGWSHPYGTGLFSPVFYNDGAEPAAADPAAPEPPKPGPPAGKIFTQAEVEALAAREKDQGKRAGARAALEDFAKANGFSNADDAKAFIEAARKAEQDALSEQEKESRRLAEERAAFEQEKAQMAADRRALLLERSLSRLGAVDSEEQPNLQDALALLERELRDQPDADAATVQATAERIKGRRGELFGNLTPATATPPTSGPPPAPGGAPAGGPPPRTPATKDDVNERARKRAEAMGFRRPAA